MTHAGILNERFWRRERDLNLRFKAGTKPPYSAHLMLVPGMAVSD
jgi:hypothetical protein